MAKSVKLVVVIPVGPTCILDYIIDSIHSIIHYTTPDRQIIIVDDSGKDTARSLQGFFLGLDVVKTPENYGKMGGLYLSLSMGYLHAHQHYDFEALLRFDTDALVIGDQPEEDAIQFFRQYPDVGLLGQYHRHVDEEYRSRVQLIEESRRKNFLRNPLLCMALRRPLLRALANGYDRGDYVFGAAYFMSGECVRRLVQAKLLLRKPLRRSKLEEDHIFTLLVSSVGLAAADFTAGSLPMEVAWNVLPCSPRELVAKRKKITHSTRSWEGMNEDDIRKFFREMRENHAAASRVDKTVLTFQSN